MKKIFVFLIALTAAFSAHAQNGENKMTREEIAKENYRALFNGEALTGEGNDPELMNILQKFIFGEIFVTGNLKMQTRELLTVVSLTVQQTLPQLKAHMNAALNVGVTPVALREAVYQCAPFIGFPKTLNAVAVMNDVFAARNIQTPLEKTGTVDESDRFAKGFAIQNPIYGDEIRQAMAGLPDDMGADVARFLTEFGFGDFYARDGLDVQTRELLIVGLLTTTGNLSVLKSHLTGAVKAGNSPETVAAAIIQVLPYVGFPNVLGALRTFKDAVK